MLGEEERNHEMILQATHESGEEEWYCPTCGRRFLMQWPPRYSKTILEPGDVTANHSGGKGGLRIGSTEMLQPEQLFPAKEADLQDPHLLPWRQWMEKVDFESWWTRDLK